MGLGINTEQTTTEHTQDSFDEFLDSLKQPRQVMAPELDAVEAGMEMTPPVDPAFSMGDDTPTEQKKRYNLSMIPAETLVNCVDIAFTQVNSIIAKQKVEGATPEETQVQLIVEQSIHLTATHQLITQYQQSTASLKILTML